MVGLHVRNVFDAPRDVATAKTALGKEAVRRAATRVRHLPYYDYTHYGTLSTH